MGKTCRISVLGKSFKGKVSKEQRKQINNCKLNKLKKGGYSKKAAGAILASASRKASAKAKRKNPKLKKVKGKAKK